jgi:hypothetical protein
MCGIAGLIHRGNTSKVGFELQGMLQALKHNRIKLNGELITFVDRNTKAYTVGDVLFAEIYKGSEYNRLTKELNIKLALYLPTSWICFKLHKFCLH